MPPVITKDLVYYQEQVEEMCGGLSLEKSIAKKRLLRKLNGISLVRASWDEDRLTIIITAKNQRSYEQAHAALGLRFTRIHRRVTAAIR